MRFALSLLVVGSFGGALLLPRGVRAQGKDADPQLLATAQAVFEEGVRYLNEKRYDLACPRFEEVVRLVPAGLGAKFTLAECYEGAGKTASAWMTYVVVETGARAAGNAEREAAAQGRAAALRPRLTRLTIDVGRAVRDAPGLTVERDGAPVGPVQFGVAVPVDGGAHVVVARAPGRADIRRTVTASEEGATVTVALDAWAPPRATPQAAAPGWSTQRWIGLGLAAAGAAGLGVGLGFGARALSKQGDAAPHCGPGNLCDADGVALRSDGIAAGNVSTGAFIAGAALAAAGATVFLTAPARRASGTVGVAMGPGSARVSWAF